MADPERDETGHRADDPVESINASGSTGWWVAGLLALAVLIIGFIALSGGNPAPVETTAPVGEQTAPMSEQAPAAPDQ